MNTTLIATLLAEAEELAGKGEWGYAFEALTRACELEPLHPRVLNDLGTFLVRAGRLKEAVPILEKAAALYPEEPLHAVDLGAALAFAQRNDESRQSLRRALSLDPGCLIAAKLLVVILAGEGRHQEAKEVLTAACKHAPEDSELLLLQANYCEYERDQASARQLFARLLEIQPQSREARGGLIRVSRERTQPEESKQIVMLVDDRRIDRRVLDEARSLEQAGWLVTVIAGEPPDENPFWDEECYPEIDIVRVRQANRFAVSWKERRPNVHASLPVVQVPRSLMEKHLEAVLPEESWRPWFLQRVDFYLEALARPAAVCVAHDLSQLPVAAMVTKQTGAFLVYDSHELYPDQYADRATWSLLQSMEKHLVPFADRVITVNESFAGIMKERYGKSAEVVLNCPALDAAQFPVRRTSILREDLKIPPAMRILLYQGGLVARLRNLEAIIEAMARIRRQDVALVLMGPDSGKSGAELSAIAESHGLLGTRVFFHESVRQSELLRYTASADAGIIPYPALDLLNQYYCTPNKTFEFLVAGLPILANDLPELKRFVSGQGAGMNMPMNSPEEIAQAIDAFFALDLDAIRARVQSLSRHYVWQTQGEKIVRLYGGLSGAEPRAQRARTIETIEGQIERGELALARGQLRGLLAKNQDDVPALTNQGVLEYLEGDPVTALGTLRRALALDPGNESLEENISTIEETLRMAHVAEGR